MLNSRADERCLVLVAATGERCERLPGAALSLKSTGHRNYGTDAELDMGLFLFIYLFIYYKIVHEVQKCKVMQINQITRDS